LTCWKAKSVLSARIIYQTQSNKKDKVYSTIRRHVFILNVDRQLSMEGGDLKLQDMFEVNME
jgi:hypothetical protein